MERGHHRADDQQPGVAVLHFPQSVRHQHHRIHSHSASHHDPAVGETEPAAKGDERASAQTQRDTGTLLQGSTAYLPGNHEDLQAGGRKPVGLPGAHVHPVPYMDRAVPGTSPDPTVDSGESGGPLGPPLLVASDRAPDNPSRQLFPVARSGEARLHARYARPGGRLHVPHAEDDHHADAGPQAGVNKPHDAVDDAVDVRLLHPAVPKRSGAVLGGLKHRWCGDTGIHYRLGAHQVACFVRTLPGAGHSPGASALGEGGNRCPR